MTREERKIQREIDFTDWWLRERKMEGIPTYAEAIEWADRTMIEKACEYLESSLKHDLGYYGAADFENTFKKAMEE